MEFHQLSLGRLRTRRVTRVLDLLVPLSFAAGMLLVFPLGTAFQLGADEGYELMKGWLVSLGHPLYREIWNDQPPLHTELLALSFRVFGPSAYVARILTVAFATLLTGSLYSVVKQQAGRAAALISLSLLMASTSFLQLSASVMLEVPAFSLALASFAAWRKSCRVPVGRAAPPAKRFGLSPSTWWLIVSGVVLGLALQVKFTAALILPAFAADILLAGRPPAIGLRRAVRGQLRALLIIAGSALAAFTLVALAFYSRETLAASRQSHFSNETQESAAAFRFHPALLLGEPALLAPAALGGIVILLQRRSAGAAPVVFFLTSLLVHAFHRPFWSYYILHLTLPLAWLGGIGIAEGIRTLWRAPWPGSGMAKLRFAALLLAWALAVSTAAASLPGKLRFEIWKLRHVEAASENVMVATLKKYGSGARWIFTDQRLAAFWAGLPIPPELAVIPSKRIWSGQISAERIRSLLGRYRPEIILLSPGSAEQLGLSAGPGKGYGPAESEGFTGLYLRKP